MKKKSAEILLILVIVIVAAFFAFYGFVLPKNFSGKAIEAVKSFRDEKIFFSDSQTIEIKNDNDIGQSEADISEYNQQELTPDNSEERDINELDVEMEQTVNEEQPINNEEVENQEASVTDEENTINGVLPPAKKNLTDDLRIGFITDMHVRSTMVGNERVLKEDYAKKIDYFISQMNNEFGPDFIIANGDVIEGTKVPSAQGMHELGLIKKSFEKTTIPSYWAIGNHDLRSVSKSQWRQIFGYTSTSFVFGDYKIIIIDSNFDGSDKDIRPGSYYTRGNVAQEQVRWLKRQLRDTDNKTIVFIHHPPLRNIDARDNNGLLKNAEELQGLFEKYEPVAVFSGHIEDLYYKKDKGVKYFVIPGIDKHPKYSGTFAEITINGSKTDVNLNYISKAGYKKIKVN